MKGNEVFKVAVNTLGRIVDETLEANALKSADIDWLIPHQANIRIIQATARKLKMPMDRVVVTVDEHGNTSAASVPLALDVAVRDGRIQRGEMLLMEAFGGGFTWGSRSGALLTCIFAPIVISGRIHAETDAADACLCLSGQGSQSVGMLAPLADGCPAGARKPSREASEVLGYDLWRLVQDGPEVDAQPDRRTQPAMLAAGVAVWRCWHAGGDVLPAWLAGHSLGEYTALVCAGALRFARRGRGWWPSAAMRMQQAVPAGTGGMAAILGLDDAAGAGTVRAGRAGRGGRRRRISIARAGGDRRPRRCGRARDGAGKAGRRQARGYAGGAACRRTAS